MPLDGQIMTFLYRSLDIELNSLQALELNAKASVASRDDISAAQGGVSRVDHRVLQSNMHFPTRLSVEELSMAGSDGSKY